MNQKISELDGFQPLSWSEKIKWNTDFRSVRDLLKSKSVIALEEQGMQLLRFEQVIVGQSMEENFGVQNQLQFSPDYNYGLRLASVYIETAGGSVRCKDVSGSYKPLAEAYMKIYRELEGRYGPPDIIRGFVKDDIDTLARLLDVSRDAKTITACWVGTHTHISHDLNIHPFPKHSLSISAVGVSLFIENRTGKNDLVVSIKFPGGSTNIHSWDLKKVELEVPYDSECEVTGNLGKHEIKEKIHIKRDPFTIIVNKQFLSNKIGFKVIHSPQHK